MFVVVVLGLDPYPKLAQATGRAFEQDNWDRRTQSLAHSLKPLMLAALLETVMPDWRHHKDALNSLPLAYDKWTY